MVSFVSLTLRGALVKFQVESEVENFRTCILRDIQ